MRRWDFLLPIIDRLVAAWRRSQPGKDNIVVALGDALRAVELHLATFTATRHKVIEHLTDKGIDPASAASLASGWLRQGDFLLEPFAQRFDFIVGNPPYVRQECIPAPLLLAYRRRYATLYDRADLYIPFIERALTLLSQHGTLGFICSDLLDEESLRRAVAVDGCQRLPFAHPYRYGWNQRLP